VAFINRSTIMANPRHALALALAALLAVSASQATAADAHHDHGDPGDLKVELDQGKKWQTDAALRRGMAATRDELAALLPRIHKNTLPTSEYAALAQRLQGHIQYVFDNCELPPAADAQLHAVLAQMLYGVETMRSGETPREGAVRTIRSLEAYAAHFDHAGWQALRH
jgi:hypothetical protein